MARAERDAGGGDLLTVAQIRAVEADWLASLPPGALMHRAATAVADCVAALPGGPVLLLVGPGNNGGDALVAGRLLRARGLRVHALLVNELLTALPRAADAARALADWPLHDRLPLAELPGWLARYSEAIVVDGLFGIGLTRPITGAVADAIAALQTSPAAVVAIDVPSGLDADRGVAVGGGAVVHADVTVTMIADKPGLHTGIGRAVSGRIEVVTLRTPVVGEAVPDRTERDAGHDDRVRPLTLPAVAPGLGTLLTAQTIAPCMPWRLDDAHKGSHGDVLIIGGRLGMAGAARLAARGALAGGAGRVSIADLSRDPDLDRLGPADPQQPEVMRRLLPARGPLLSGRLPVLVIGCGLGRDASADRWLLRALATDAAAVIDADALNLIASSPASRRALQVRATRRLATVLTPHPLEAARLLGVGVADLAADRIAAARRLARELHAVVVVKGAGTVVASPGGPYAINGSGHPVLATGGSGDVLAGMIGAVLATLLAEGDNPALAAARAACVGVWVHGAAGEWLAREIGPFGVPAGRIADAVPAVYRELLDSMRSSPTSSPLAMRSMRPQRRASAVS